MLIDEFLPQYDVAKRYQIDIQASAEAVYPFARQLDFSNSPLIRTLFRIRGLPQQSLHIEGLLKNGFIFLDEKENKEMLLGLAGRFWVLSGDIQRLTPDGFRQFHHPGYAKAVWNFFLYQHSENITRLITETRVYCPDERSRKKFLRYWRLIGPFSGLIRREILKTIKNKAENLTTEEAYHV
jgi:hypothetical protein